MAGDSDQWARYILEALNRLAYSPSNTWEQSATYSQLPDPTTVSGQTWLVLSGTGIWPVNKPSGWYYSDGNQWLYLGSYNPVASGGNVFVTNFPSPATQGVGNTAVIADTQEILTRDDLRKGFVLTLEEGLLYIGLGFPPTQQSYTYRMKGYSVVEKDGYTGSVYALSDGNPATIYITEIK